jgi:hypothetical protein
MSEIYLPRTAKKRRSYAARSGMDLLAAKIAAKAMIEQPVFVEDADGHRIRQWKPEELQRYSNDEIKEALRLKRVVEPEDMLEFVPPSAIKYCVTKGWIVKAERGGYFHITRKAAADLELPRKHQGRTIQFMDRGL